MTEKTKKVLMKLHLSFFVLSLIISTSFSIYVIVASVHDSIIKTNAINCLDNEEALEFRKRTGRAWSGFVGFISNEDMDAIMHVQADPIFQSRVDVKCDVEYIVTNTETSSKTDKISKNTWIGSNDLYSNIENDLWSYVCLIMLAWIPPALLFYGKKWVNWLVK
jgi:hypothetical protein